MDPREVFVEKALAIHREYEIATGDMRRMMKENNTFGPDWNAADARQRAVLEEWSSLLRRFPGIHTAVVSVKD
ncbi:hypothetical protein PSH90_12060 [Pseudomonas sp. FP1762]|uniref:hypothetical protein n=1 Tax=Pseudomonas sp. FP1762 TaxID=2954080 RepID=UPI0027345C07|nr:hypothetical protein [Pseudomonas sp. FP1762]WLG64799.1 hypothetical protein PSH90_12060 [Pseudomonas sp. FP1762]